MPPSQPSNNRWLSYLSWPTACGLLLGLLVMLALQNQQLSANNGPDKNFSLKSLSPSSEWSSPASYADAVANAAPSVVNIYTRTKLKRQRHPLFEDPLFRHFFKNSNQPQQERMQSALGSGVIISDKGYILTNNHVIADADEIVVLLTDGREALAQKVGTDSDSDLAVLKVELNNLKAITVGTPDNALVGDVVLAIGNPFGVGQTVTQGIISATGRYGLGINTYENYLQTDAAINPGNSGGALIDAYGNLLGINTAILDKTGYSVGIGFAIPADTAVSALEDIVTHGQVVRGWLGVEAQQLSEAAAEKLQLNTRNGVIVTAIYNGGPAHKAGLRPGDIILRINELWVSDGRLSMNQVAARRPGDEVKVAILRQGKQQTVAATLGTKPKTSR